MANLVKLQAQCLTNQSANSDFTMTFTPVFSIRSGDVHFPLLRCSDGSPLDKSNDRSSRSSPFLKQLSDSLHALLLIAFDHDFLVSQKSRIPMIVATANSLADLSRSTVAPAGWIGFSFIDRIVSTSSSVSMFAKQKSIATMGMSGGGPQSLRWEQSRANPFTQCEHQPLNGKWVTECANLSSSRFFLAVFVSVARSLHQRLLLVVHHHFLDLDAPVDTTPTTLSHGRGTHILDLCADVSLSRPCPSCFSVPFPSQHQTLSQQDDSHSGLDGEQEAIRRWLSH